MQGDPRFRSFGMDAMYSNVGEVYLSRGWKTNTCAPISILVFLPIFWRRENYRRNHFTCLLHQNGPSRFCVTEPALQPKLLSFFSFFKEQ